MGYQDPCQQWWRDEPCPELAIVGINGPNGTDGRWVCERDFREYLQQVSTYGRHVRIMNGEATSEDIAAEIGDTG